DRSADYAAQIDIELGQIGAAQVPNVDQVSATQGVQVNSFDIVEVHHDVADVAREPHALAVGRHIELRGDVGAGEEPLIRAVAALDGIAAVARIPLERVVAGAEENRVVPLIAVDEVVAVTAQQSIVAVASENRVVSGPAVHRDLNQRRQITGGREVV